MWIFILFDLPTETKKQKKAYTDFRKELLKLGFTMQQFSVYSCFCGSRERMEVQIKKVQRRLPTEGHVMMIHLTDKQYEGIENYYCRSRKMLDKGPEQLELF